MDKIRIGKDIIVTGMVTVNGAAVNLEGLELVAVAASKSDTMKEYPLELVVCGSSFTITLRGADTIGFLEDGVVEYKMPLGKYIISLWQNRGKVHETAWDVQVFQLVSHTFKENDDEDGLEVSHVDLGVIDFTNKYLMELRERVDEFDAVRDEYEVLKVGLGEYKVLFEEIKVKYESGELNGRDLRFEDLTDEQKAELRGEKGEDGKDGLSGGFLFPEIDYDPVTGEMVVVGNAGELQRFDYDDVENELIIRI